MEEATTKKPEGEGPPRQLYKWEASSGRSKFEFLATHVELVAGRVVVYRHAEVIAILPLRIILVRGDAVEAGAAEVPAPLALVAKSA